MKLGDVNFVNKKISDVGDVRILPHTKGYIKGVGGKVVCGLLGLAFLGVTIINISDFFVKPIGMPKNKRPINNNNNK